MRVKTIIVVLAVIFLIALLVYGYFRATPGIVTPTQKKPHIEITPSSFDFGSIKYGDVVHHTFTIKNLGDDTLQLKRVATSCSCTSAKASAMELKPGGIADLVVTYESGAMGGAHGKGQQERIIYVQSNDPLNPQIQVTTTAYVQ